jgi:hypothetical protein
VRPHRRPSRSASFTGGAGGEGRASPP